ncbi:MAG: 6-carboxytetrahydropterin synthase [Rhizobacter sp.]
MIYEVSQRFYFEAAHTLARQIDAAGSKRVHGHTYHAEVTVAGPRNAATGMVLDLGQLRQEIQLIRDVLDHSLLDEVAGLGPPTLENLCAFIAQRLQALQPPVVCVKVWREASGDSCALRLPPGICQSPA